MTTSNMRCSLSRLFSGRDGCAFRERLRWIKSNNENRRVQHYRTSAEVALPLDHLGGAPSRMYCPTFLGGHLTGGFNRSFLSLS
jgi:hypothetical protein